MKTNMRKSIVIKTVKDVVYVGLKVGLVVVEWRVLRRVNSMPLKYFERFMATCIIGEHVGNHSVDAFERSKLLVKRMKAYRKWRIAEDREKMNEMAKDAQFEWNEAMVDKYMNDVADSFSDLGIDIKDYQNELKETVDKLMNANEQTA